MEKHVTHKDYKNFVEGKLTEDEVNKFIEKLINVSGERVLRALPSVIDFLVKQTTYIKNLSETFYKENTDLVSHKDLVAHVLEKVESENPGKAYEELIAKVAPEVRKKLKTYKLGKDNAIRKDKKFSLTKTNEDLGML